MSGLLPVEEAQARLLALRAPMSGETIYFSQSLGRYLSQDVVALRDQPAAPLSAMDGYLSLIHISEPTRQEAIS